ncbi:MAG: DUF4906 domain-containing protein [Bacteroidetes bacterium]|uniref:DUF4906 domain-containing protein n=1 Tax=Candidatus Cryptobacteroides excrementipullorum TaxID=2840761 RepID=A0A9D9ITB2_9BACT|nr:DUF4906 domain-containing protein [Candidatus Cryptobacteroides excrementipullorum]
MKRMIYAMAACALPLCSVSCTEGSDGMPYGKEEEMEIEFIAGEIAGTRSADPQENLVTDMNIYIFNDRGQLEARFYLKAGQMQETGHGYGIRVSLLSGAAYSVYALANAGYEIATETEQEVAESRYYLTYPDEYRIGIPMSGMVKDCVLHAGEPLTVPLERTMSKISLSIDRSRLDDDVTFNVRSVSIGGCPKSVTPFRKSAVMSESDTFITGFSKSDSQVSALNTDLGSGKSGEVSVYMFENMQGDLLENAGSDSDKIFGDADTRARKCSYIEIKADYKSDSHFTMPDDRLIYRFYLGESRTNFDVRRNVHYHITVAPEGDGLSEDSWRVDQSGINSYTPYYMKVIPGTFIRGKVDETFHIRCEYYPESASFDIGVEELEYDKERGIYDYVIDDDGKGVRLHLKGRGSGMLYFETGAPINKSEIVTVIVE